MRRLACSILVLVTAASCASTPEPRPEPAAQPLVIGTSPPGPVAPVKEHDDAPAPKAVAPATTLAIPARDPRLARGATRTAVQPQPDEALYYTGLDQELAGNASGARRSYYEVIRNFPSSPLVPFAYFAFGELFLSETENDPSKAQLAEQAYREVLKYPPAQNPLYVEAQRRLAELGLMLKRP